MILLLIVIIFAMIPAACLLRKSKGVYWYIGIILGWSLCTAAFLLFYAKTAGFSYYVNRILFMFDFIRIFLLYIPVNLAQITLMQVFGRSVFAVCLLGFACSKAELLSPDMKKRLCALNALFAALNFFFYLPPLYRSRELPSGLLFAAAVMTRLWILAAVLLAFTFLFLRYRKTTFKWFKNKQSYLNSGILALTGFYLYVILRGPIQYMQPRGYFHLYGSFNYYNPPISPAEWLVWQAALLVLLAVSLYSYYQYSRYEKRFQTEDIRLNNKIVFMRSGVSILSHAMKNQLISTGFMLEDAAKQLRDSDSRKADQLIHQVIDQNNAMLERLNRLRDTLKQREFNPRNVKVHQLLDRLSGHIHPPGDIRFTITSETPDLSLFIDLNCMEEVVTNIITNAFEALGSSGEVWVSQRLEDEWCIIEVSDNGPGMDEITMEQIFDPFFSNKNSSSNWGIGLSFSRQAAAAHGGTIEVSSRLHKGTVFSILLPHL